MARNSVPLDSELEAVIKDLLESRHNGKGAARYEEEEVTSALTDALSEALARMLSQASPLERLVFLDALAPALADALAPALAEALAPALIAALGTIIAPKKTSQDAGSGEAARKPEKK
jgi:hypothetical protein